jgi:transposase
MIKFNLDTRIEIYNEYKKGRALQELSRTYEMSFTNLRYMVKFIDRYGIENYIKPGHYSYDLKETLIQRVIHNEDSIFNIALDGGLKSRTQLADLVKKYQINGYNIVERKRGRSTMPKEKTKRTVETIEQENERLRKENLYLKAELEYSKKLRAVVQARKNRQQKKK